MSRRNRLALHAWTLACLLAAAGAQAQVLSCSKLKADLTARYEATGVRGYSLQVVPASAPVPAGAQSVGTCDGGTNRVLYRKLAIIVRPFPGAETLPRPASAPSRAIVPPTLPQTPRSTVIVAPPSASPPPPPPPPPQPQAQQQQQQQQHQQQQPPPPPAPAPVVTPPPVQPAPVVVPAPAPRHVPRPATRPRPVTPRPAQPPPTAGDGSGVANALRAVDDAVARMTQAQIAFNTPGAMNLGDSAQIQLLLSLNETIDDLKRAVQGPGGREGAQVAVAERMEARLSGANFRITAVTPEEQALASTDNTEWRWEVQPTLAGEHPLHLSLSAVFRVDGSPAKRSVRTFDKTIVVRVTFARQMADFFAANWQWLWAVLVVPVAGWLWKRRRVAPAG